MLDEYWDEVNTTYSNDFYLWTDWLYQYFNELQLCEVIESAYLTWNLEKNILTPKYDILH